MPPSDGANFSRREDRSRKKKNSRAPTSAKGALVFEVNDLIAKYQSELISKEEHDQRYYKTHGPYVLDNRFSKGGGDVYYDAACVRGLGSIANDPRGTGFKANARLVVGKNGASLRALRSIFDGEEILASYGKGYWKGR